MAKRRWLRRGRGCGKATEETIRSTRTRPLSLLPPRRNAHGQRRCAEPRISDLDEVHRLEQAILPAKPEGVGIAKQQSALQHEFGHDGADIRGVDNCACLQRTVAADAV